jgi:hypothetical protein
MAIKCPAYLKCGLYIGFSLPSTCYDLLVNLGTMGDVSVSECWMKILEELVKCRLIKQVECFIFRDNELDKMGNQAL